MLPIRKTVQLSQGTVTLRAWGVNVLDAHLLDLLSLNATLGQMREHWAEFQRRDVEPGIWDAFWRLANASLEGDLAYPAPLTWHDHLIVLEAMWELNSLDDAEGKVQALTSRAARMLYRLSQGQTMT